MLDHAPTGSFRDFVLPLSAENSGRAITDDWYRIHVRLAATLGERTEGGQTRYQFSDEPSLPARGRAVRIRAIAPEVKEILERMGLPEIDTIGLVSEGQMKFGLMMSARAANMQCAVRNEDLVRRKIAQAGLQDLVADGPWLRRMVYSIRKGGKRGFKMLGYHATFRAQIGDMDAFQFAMRSGLGRDRGFGFGILTPLEESAT